MSFIKIKEAKYRIIIVENIKKTMKNLLNKKKWLSWKRKAVKFGKKNPILSLYLAVIISGAVLIFFSQIIREHNNSVREKQNQEQMRKIMEENTYILNQELYERVITFNGLFDIVNPKDRENFDDNKNDNKNDNSLEQDEILLDKLNRIDDSLKSNEILKAEFEESKTKLDNSQSDDLNSVNSSDAPKSSKEEEQEYVVLKPDSKMIVKAKVPVDYFNSISFGLNATVSDIDSKYEFNGTVAQIDPGIDSSKNNFYLEINLDTEPAPHLIDKIAQVKIKTLARPMFLVPKDYVYFDQQERPYVFIDGQKKYVIATLENDGRYRIVFDGITNGIKLEKNKQIIEK